MNRLTTLRISTTWVCPAGVTTIMVMPTNSSGLGFTTPIPLDVVPNTSYVVTINTSTYNPGTSNTFGSLYVWSDPGFLTLMWVE